MRKLFACIFTFLFAMILCLPTDIFASETYDLKLQWEETITDPILLDKMISEEDIDVPEGYELESVVVSSYTADDNEDDLDNINEDFTKDNSATPLLFDTWKVKNSKKVASNFSFQNSPIISDWIDGPAKYSQQFVEKVAASFSSELSVSADIIKAGVGFSVSDSRTFTRNYSTKIPKNKKINIKVFGNYDKYKFSIYKNDNYVGQGYAYKPVGLKIERSIFKLKR